MWRRTVMLLIARQCARRRPASLSGSRSLSRPVRQSTTTSEPQTRSRVSTSLPAVAAATELLRHGNMLGSSASGSPASGSTQAYSAHIRYAEPRPHSFTVAPTTCAVQLLLGHKKIESTVGYLGIEVDDALATAEQIDV